MNQNPHVISAFDLPTERIPVKDELKLSIVAFGALSVVARGTIKMLLLFVDSSDTRKYVSSSH